MFCYFGKHEKDNLYDAGVGRNVEFASFAEDKIQQALMSADKTIASGGIDSCVSQGEAMLPKLRKWAGSEDPRLKARARTALGRITGQWGSQTDVIWKRSLAKAIEESKATGKPILMLHLFGKLDEEFC